MHGKFDGKEHWSDSCNVYYIADPPTANVTLDKVGLPSGVPAEWEDVVPRTNYKENEEFRTAYEMMGDDGAVAVCVGLPGLSLNSESIYEYCDDPSTVIARCEQQHSGMIEYLGEALAVKPDFVLIGISGFMISNPEPIFRQLSLRTLQETTAICKQAGVPTQVHCCGPEYALVKIAAEESDLSSINPLEIAPMGNCDLARVKREFGSRIGLMGNLHTTDVMLFGSPLKVIEESKKAIDAAGEGGGFILSTGDQCGRDTPNDNIKALVDTARDYGRY